MSDYFHGAIQIGGPFSRILAPKLAQAIADAGALAEAAPATLSTAGDLIAATDKTTGVLRFYNHEACYGCFTDLENWLRDHGISFDRQSDARYEFDGETVAFRPDLGLIAHTATQEGEATVLLDELLPVRVLLRAALAERSPEKVRGALASLDKVLGPEIPPLPPFVLID